GRCNTRTSENSRNEMNYKDHLKTLSKEELVEQLSYMIETLAFHDQLFEKLEEAYTPQHVIEQHIKDVGGFVSGLNIVCTEEDIINRACEILKNKKENKINE